MANFTKRTSATRRYEYVMKTPEHISELSKALAVAHRDMQDYVGRTGDSPPEIWATQDGENIIIYWEHDKLER